jgi:hypothetical protein
MTVRFVFFYRFGDTFANRIFRSTNTMTFTGSGDK